MPPYDPPTRTPYLRSLRVTSVFVMAVAVLVFVGGWLLDFPLLRSVIPGAVGMKASTALGLFFCAASLLAQTGQDIPGGRRLAGRAMAAVPAVLAVLVLSEYLAGWNLGIDELPFTDRDGRAQGIAHPGRFAPTTGVCFLLVALALCTLDRAPGRRWRPSEMLVVPVALVATTSLVGYLYSITVFYGPASAAKMAVNTAVCFVALAVGIVLARPRGRLLELATTTDPGGMLVRQLLPLAVVAPLALGWLHLRTVQWGWFDNEVGTWWAAVGTMVVLGGMMWRVAAALSRSDVSRKMLEARLYLLATSDQMTGAFNRHRFEEEVSRFLARGRRTGSRGALLVLDLDRLKSVNDELGHLAGDQLLRAVSAAMVDRLRVTDAVGRLGGDEFAVLLLDVDEVQAMRLAEELLTRIRAIRIETSRGHSWTTVSIGIACAPPFSTENVDQLIERADRAMYSSKERGGDCATADGRPHRPEAALVAPEARRHGLERIAGTDGVIALYPPRDSL